MKKILSESRKSSEQKYCCVHQHFIAFPVTLLVSVTYDNNNFDEKMKLIYLLSIFSIQIDAFGLADFHEELFESGTFRPEDKRKNATLKYLSSSTEDLVLLFKAEQELFREILQVFESVDAKTQELIEKYKEVVDFE